MFFGAPYAALSKKRIKTMKELLNPKQGKKLLDLGSGDGRIVIAFNNDGIDAYGIELNPILVLVSKFKMRKQKLKSKKIIFGDYWRHDFSKYNYITVWVVPPTMGRLEKKLLKELKPGALVASNHLKFPNWKYSKKKNDVYLYKKQ